MTTLLSDIDIRPDILEMLNGRGITTLAQLSWNVGEGHLDDLPTADQIYITTVLNKVKGTR